MLVYGENDSCQHGSFRRRLVDMAEKGRNPAGQHYSFSVFHGDVFPVYRERRIGGVRKCVLPSNVQSCMYF